MKTWEELGIDIRGKVTGEVKTICPQCSQYRKKKNYPCLNCNLDKGVYNCWHCDWSGSLKDGEEKRSNPRATPVMFRKPVYRQTPLPIRVLEWFARRGIPEHVLARNRISYGPVYMPQLEQEVGTIQFPYFRDGEVVNVKYRDGHKYFRMVGGAERLLYGWDDIQGDTLVICEGECFRGDAEILTTDGWCKFTDYRGGPVAQYEADGRLSMVHPLALIQKEFDGELVCHTNTHRFFTCVTPEHQMVSCDVHGTLRKHDALRPASYADTIPRVGVFDGPGVPLSDDQLAFCLAVSADASIRTLHYRSAYAVFAFKKQRKILRLRRLISRLGLQCSDTTIANGYTSICLHLPAWSVHRMLPQAWLSMLSLSQRQFLLAEMVHWDGNSVPHRAQTEYSTKHYANAVWMQTLAHTCGMVSTIMRRKSTLGTWFKVSVLHKKTSSSWQGIQTERIPYCGPVYCVQVPSGMLLVRQGECISVSGNCDKLAIEVAGMTACVSVPDGAPALNTKHYETKFDYLVAAEALIAPLTKIILAVDNDAPGQRLAEELARRLGPERCWRVTWASDCKDANDVLMSYGPDVLRECLDNAEPWPVSGVITVDMLSSAIDHMYHHGVERGLSPGWPELAQHYTVRAGECTIVTGIPSHGKSFFVSAMVVNLAMLHGWKTAMFSPENYPLERYAALLMEQYTGVAFDGVSGRMPLSTLYTAQAWLGEHISFLMPEDDVPTIARLLDLARIQVYRYGVKGLVLDPWNEIEHARPAGQTETEYISHALSQVRRFARHHGVHVWIVAHPTKLRKDEKGPYAGQYPPPTPYDISGSAHFRNKADNCVTVWRNVEANDHHVQIHVQKVRFREIGRPGVIELIYEPSCGRFHAPRLEEQAWRA